MDTYNINLACSGSGYELDTIIQGPFQFPYLGEN